MNRRLRVLQVVEATFDGVGRHVLDLSDHLIEHDHHVDLVWCPDRSEPRFVDRLATLDVRHRRELPPGTGAWTGLARVGFELKAFVDANGPYDVVHGHSSRGGAWARLLPHDAKRIYTPNALITQAVEIGHARRRFFARIERLLSRRTDGMIYVSPEEARHGEAIGLRPAMMTTIPNGIDLVDLPSRQAAREALGLAPEEFVFGSVGRLVSQKGHDQLISAFSRYARDGGKGVLVIIGEGPEEQNLRTQAADLGVAPRVRFLGRQPGQASMPAFDVFVLASRYEGFPYVMLEAMWAGLPLLISDRASVSSLLGSGVNGVSAPPTPDSFAEAMRLLAADDDGRRAMGKRAAQTVTQYSTKAMAEETLEFYRQVITGSPAKR